MARTKSKGAAAARPPRNTTLLIATRKGLWTLAGDAARRNWKIAGPQFLGHIVHHAVLDPRDGQHAARRGAHRTPRPDDLPLDRPRAHVEGGRAARRRSSRAAGAPSITRSGSRPAIATEPGVWYAGTSPQGLFRSDRRRRDAGPASRASTSIRSARRGAAATRTARPTDRSCIRSSSIRAIRSTCTSACRAAASSSRPTAAPIGGRSTTACAPTSCPTRTRSSGTIRIACACTR